MDSEEASFVISGSYDSHDESEIINASYESDNTQRVVETSKDMQSQESESKTKIFNSTRFDDSDLYVVKSEDESFIDVRKSRRRKPVPTIESDSDSASNHSESIAILSSDSDGEDDRSSSLVKEDSTALVSSAVDSLAIEEIGDSLEEKDHHESFGAASESEHEVDSRAASVNSVPLISSEQSLEVIEETEEEANKVTAQEKLPKENMVTNNYPIFNSVDTPAKSQGAETHTIKAGETHLNYNILPEMVTKTEYMQQTEKVDQLLNNLQILKCSIVSVDFKKLKDNGKNLLDRERMIRKLLGEEKNRLERMKITEVLQPSQSLAAAAPTWEQLQRDAALVQPHTFGTQALNTVDSQRAMTMDVLCQLHKSLEERPAPEVLADTPPQCNIELMPHQRHALAFMTWRETKKPSGGLLADDMGLGKTLTVICLCLNTLADTRKSQASKEWKAKGRSIRPAGVLIVCPASVMGQWVKEVKQRLRKDTLDVLEYHGTNRHQDTRHLHRADMVLTTFATLSREHTNSSQLFNLQWRRVVLDEAHQVRNHKTQGSAAVCALRAESRWALTGTPIHNEQLDMYGIMKYLHCEPFDDLAVWKRWVSNKRTGGDQRLNSALQALMLRRTKAEMIESGALCTFPERTYKTIEVTLDRDERIIYSKILVFSKTLFTRFLQQRAEKQGVIYDPSTGYKNNEFDKFRRAVLKISKGDVKQSDILTLLLRLRQICIHPTLITKMLETTDIETVGTDPDDLPDDKDVMMNLLDKLDQLKLQENDTNTDEHVLDGSHYGDVAGAAPTEQMSLNDAVKRVFKKDHPVFDPNRMSSKIRVCFDLLKKTVFPAGDKAIIVSQWTSLLKLIANHLKENGIPFCSLDGTVKISDRQAIIDQLNNSKNSCKIMLLSLTAGGVGLNLVGANHLVILDPHWNPQLESQAQDRIYRMGQKKLVHIYRLIATDSIEQGIVELQKKKLQLAHSMLTGTTISGGNKLTLDDLKMLFNMGV